MVEVITQGKARASKRDKAEEGLPLDIAVVGSMSTGKSYLALRYTDGRDMDAEALKQSVTLGGVRVSLGCVHGLCTEGADEWNRCFRSRTCSTTGSTLSYTYGYVHFVTRQEIMPYIVFCVVTSLPFVCPP